MLDRTVAPPARSISDIDIPFPQTSTLGNGYPTLLVPEKSYPVISFELILSGGKWHEQHPGTSYYAAKMIAEGAAGFTAEEISLKFESTGSFLEIVPSTDWVIFRLHTLTKFFEPALRLLFDLIREASFPPDRFEKLSQLREQNIRTQLAKNTQFANLTMGEQLFGKVHPYGRNLMPEMATKVPLDQVKEFYNKQLFHEPKIMLVGDFEAYLPLVNELARQMPGSKAETLTFSPDPGDKTLEIERGGSTQASIRIAATCINKSHEDIHGYTMVHMLLGGYFGSRLMKNLREEKGLTYGIYSQIAHQGNASYWVIGSEVKKDDVQLAVSEIEKEIEGLHEKEPSMEELAIVKNYARGKLLSSFDSSTSIAAIHRPQFMAGIPFTHLNNYLQVLNEITPADIKSLAIKHLHPTHKVIIA
ncbi:MAG: pitrilysin family protein [Cytophagales bacterium]|nr:pitrilysin family protein [Cytophagales bacterium]